MRFDVRALSGTKEVVLLMQREGGDFENFGVAACEVGTSFVTCTVSGEIPAGEPLVNFAVHGGAEPVDFLVDRAVLLLDAASDAGLPDPSDAGSEESGDAGASDAGSDPNPETDASLLNLFVNASFDANFDGWDYYAPGGAVSWSESEGAVLVESNAAGNPWDVTFKQLFNNLAVGSYTVSFDLRTVSGTKTPTFYAAQEGGTPDELFLVEDCPMVTPVWTTCTKTFTIGASVPVTRIGFDLGQSAVDIYIDNAVLTRN
jgi:hypothetical protein